MASSGLRSRKKAQTRLRIADVAADLFAEHGYDAVSVVEVARAAEVSEQTVYNYFPAKQDLVLDLAAHFRDLYRSAVTERPVGTSPAAALVPLVRADVERFRADDLGEARGQFIAVSVESSTLRRFTLEERERQVQTIAEAIIDTTLGLPRLVAFAHAAAIVAVIQLVHDQIGNDVLSRAPQDAAAEALLAQMDVAFASLDTTYAALLTHADTPSAERPSQGTDDESTEAPR